MRSPAVIRTRVVQLEVRPGRPEANTVSMLDAVGAARADGIDLLVFPEMAVPGYLLGDEWEREAFLRACEACGERIRAASHGLVVVFGNVGVDWTRRGEDGRVRKYNACFVAEDGCFVRRDGEDLPFAAKALLPNYREFDDTRHFFDLRKLAAERGRSLRELLTPVRTRRFALGCLLCEDAWHVDYGASPFDCLVEHGVDLVVNLSCSPFTLNKNHKRNRVFSALAERHRMPMVYANAVGLQNNGKTVYTFDGASCVYDGHGGQANGALEPFEAGRIDVEIPLGGGARFGSPVVLRDDGVDTLQRALHFGIARFLALCRVERVVVGVSGGVDSAVTAALYSLLLPPENLLLVNMPSRFNSTTTRSLARALAANTGCLFAEVPIEDSVAVTLRQIDGLEIAAPDGSLRRTLRLDDFARENVQARDRSSRVLAALAAAFGGVFTCNANKSEATVGYTTLYGDLGGYLAALGDLWKTEVWDLARHLNAEVFGRELIPRGSIDIVPSAELSAAQNVDEGRGDPIRYPYHDRLFASWVEWWNRATPEEALVWYLDGTLERRIGYDGRVADLFPDAAAFTADLERWWNQYQGMGVAKRIQAPPVLAVKRRAFGFDHREAQLGPRYTARYEDLKQQALARGHAR